MLSNADFLIFTQWTGILTLACGLITLLSFLFKWGIRFRLVGVTGFLGVLTGGFFGLSLVPFTRTVIPDAMRYVVVYDNGGPQAVVTVAPTIKESQLDATLRQAASDLFSFGRLGDAQNQMTIQARTVIHPKPGVSQPLFLGEVKRSLGNRQDESLAVNIYSERFAQLPQVASEPSS